MWDLPLVQKTREGDIFTSTYHKEFEGGFRPFKKPNWRESLRVGSGVETLGISVLRRTQHGMQREIPLNLKQTSKKHEKIDWKLGFTVSPTSVLKPVLTYCSTLYVRKDVLQDSAIFNE